MALSYFGVILLLSGDISINPGPQTRYPCSICNRPVRCNQKALLCDLCDLWSHCRCSGAGDQVYSHYQQVEHFSWCCPCCIAGSLPFNDCSFLTSEDSLLACIDDNISTNLGLPQTSAGLRIAHLNCRSLLSHKDDILDLTNVLHLDILSLSET